MWNSLNNNIRNVDTLSKFKSELKKIDETEDNNSQPVSLYKISVLVKIGKPVTILAASS
jgi:hypothetical protein